MPLPCVWSLHGGQPGAFGRTLSRYRFLTTFLPQLAKSLVPILIWALAHRVQVRLLMPQILQDPAAVRVNNLYHGPKFPGKGIVSDTSDIPQIHVLARNLAYAVAVWRGFRGLGFRPVRLLSQFRDSFQGVTGLVPLDSCQGLIHHNSALEAKAPKTP